MTRPDGLTPRPGWRLMLEWGLVALFSSALVILLVLTEATARLDNVLYGAFLRAGEQAPRSDILIVAIDNRSLEEAGRWPWPRNRHAALIEALARGRPRAIAYDVLFVEPSDSGSDAALGRAIGQTRLVLPMLMRSPGTNGAAIDAILPIAPARTAAVGIGHVNLVADSDGLIRRATLSAGDQRRSWPHLVEALRRAAGLTTAGDAPPVNADGLIPYDGPPGTFRTISAASVLRGELPPEFLKDKLVLVGATADGLGDTYPTPVSGSNGVMSGIEIQANLLDALLGGRLIRPMSPVPLALLSLAPLWLLLLAFLRLPPRGTVLLLGGLLALVAAAVTGALLGLHLWMPPVAALLGIAIVYPLWGWRRLSAVSGYMIEELERLRAEPEWLSRSEPRPLAVDPVGRQALLLRDAIGRMADMRQFVVDRLQQMPDSTFVTDNDGQIVLANREAERLCEDIGVDPHGDIAALIWQLRSVRPDEALPVFPRTDSVQAQHDVLLGDGRSFDLRIVRQHDRDGVDIGWIVRVIDTSAAKAAERQREEVLRLLSHDMRSPQSSIIAALDGAGADEIAPGLNDRIRAHTMRTIDLADGFVQLARAESLEYETEDFDLNDVAIEAADAMWERASRQHTEIVVEVAEEAVVVRGERSLITRAIGNLLDNALKYGGPGGRIVCRDVVRDRHAVLTVEDRGIGIAADQVGRLFEQFRRAPGAAQRADGVGLGLAFVHTVATRHGGSIRCESIPGEGTTFSLILPLAPD